MKIFLAVLTTILAIDTVFVVWLYYVGGQKEKESLWKTPDDHKIIFKGRTTPFTGFDNLPVPEEADKTEASVNLRPMATIIKLNQVDPVEEALKMTDDNE